MFFIFVHLDDVLIPSMTWNDLFWNCTDNKNKWRHFFNLFVPPLNRSHQFYSWTVSISFASQMIWNTGKIIAEVRSYIIKWCCRCRGRIRRLSSLMSRSINKSICRMKNRRDCNPREPVWKDDRKCQGQLDAQIFISHELSVRNQV